MSRIKINRRIAVIAAGVTLAAAGVANAAEISPDFNKSGAVGLEDLQAFMSAYTSGNKAADVNGDGSIGIGDVFAFVQAWTTGYIKEGKKPDPILPPKPVN